MKAKLLLKNTKLILQADKKIPGNKAVRLTMEALALYKASQKTKDDRNILEITLTNIYSCARKSKEYVNCIYSIPMVTKHAPFLNIAPVPLGRIWIPNSINKEYNQYYNIGIGKEYKYNQNLNEAITHLLFSEESPLWQVTSIYPSSSLLAIFIKYLGSASSIQMKLYNIPISTRDELNFNITPLVAKDVINIHKNIYILLLFILFQYPKHTKLAKFINQHFQDIGIVKEEKQILMIKSAGSHVHFNEYLTNDTLIKLFYEAFMLNHSTDFIMKISPFHMLDIPCIFGKKEKS